MLCRIPRLDPDFHSGACRSLESEVNMHISVTVGTRKRYLHYICFSKHFARQLSKRSEGRTNEGVLSPPLVDLEF
jgi:hypothetical protein